MFVLTGQIKSTDDSHRYSLLDQMVCPWVWAKPLGANIPQAELNESHITKQQFCHYSHRFVPLIRQTATVLHHERKETLSVSTQKHWASFIIILSLELHFILSYRHDIWSCDDFLAFREYHNGAEEHGEWNARNLSAGILCVLWKTKRHLPKHLLVQISSWLFSLKPGKSNLEDGAMHTRKYPWNPQLGE